jgi:hypothetical protein
MLAQQQCGDGFNAETGAVGELNLEASGKAKVTAFLQTSTKISAAAKEIEADAVEACREMGKDLGMTDAELTVADDASDPGAKIKGVCAKVAAKIKLTIEETVPADAQLTFTYTPAKCTVDAMAQVMCTKTCEQKEVTETDIVCKPGKLSFSCGASCTGSCTGSCTAQCTGTCSADCMGECDAEITGTCMGMCQGQCDGTCSAMGADGRCMGTCSGTCSGKCMGMAKAKCSGTCKGQCMGTCSGSCMGSCMGSCNAMCSGAAEPPKCEEVEVKKTKTDCTSTCDASARASAMCTAPSVVLEFATNLQSNAQLKVKLDGLVTALRKGLPRFLKAYFKAKDVVEGSAKAYLDALVTVAGEVKGNVKAAACVGVATGQSRRDGQKIGGVAPAGGGLLEAVKAKGKAVVEKFACAGFTPATGMRGTTMFTGASGLKLNAMMDATVSLSKAAKEIETDALNGCKMMGEKLGVPAAMLAGDVKAVCAAVKAELDKQIAAIGAVKVRIAATPAVCTVNAMASVMCTQTCTTKTVTSTELKCKPGKLAFGCSAQCMGSCKGSCMGTISGSCTASCKGKCDARVSAKCTGMCTGSCEAMGGTTMMASGMCAGTCHGMCSGEIEGTCEGKCEGSCSAQVEASCMGSCMGGCTGTCMAMVQQPYCEEVETTMMVDECQQSCDARAKAEAMCTAPTVSVVIEGAAAAGSAATKLADAVKAGYGLLLKVQKRVTGTVQGSADVFVKGIQNAPAAIKESEPKAMAAGCLGLSVQAAVSAGVQIKASLEGAASVTASVVALASKT